MKPQFLISAMASGSGKTLFAMGLLRALKNRGLRIQPYKCGTDFFDSQILSLAAECETVHLDKWMASHTHIQHLYNRYGEKADVCITEGTSGLFDGFHKLQGSAAEMAKLLDIPILLVVNARVSGYSLAASIYGFKHFHPQVRIAGVVFSQVSSSAHYSFLRETCADAGVDCLGYLPVCEELKLPSKHTVLTLTAKRELDSQINQAAELMEKYMDIDRLLNRCNRNFPCQYTLPYSSDTEFDAVVSPFRKIRIAVARDAAFNFTYRENMARLEELGKISYFSPVYGSDLPEADLIYLPGGYPEMFARQLHRRRKLMDDLKAYAEQGGKILAEGGGMMLLGRSLSIRQGGTAYGMSGILPMDFAMNDAKLQSKYRKYMHQEMELKGKEFRYFHLSASDVPVDWDAQLIRYKNVIACSGHLYWGENEVMKLWD